MLIKSTYEIKAPIEFVYDKMTNEEIMKQVIPDLTSLSLKEIKSGSSYTLYTRNRNITVDIVEVQPPRYTHVRFPQGGWIINAIDRLESTKQGTHIKTEISMETKNLLAPLFTPVYYVVMYAYGKSLAQRYTKAIEQAYENRE
ncbi:hypothetical protein [Shimazuella kribbensis]|uniref:hypothetical protein n=1 Tax=Shimazuella kribbensis TaxID=139808 RepID=UPI000400A425|nr:hypothetical protein [Shimazuella kribbensis]